MAYLRLTNDTKVYFFDHANGGWECCGCLLQPPGTDISTYFTELDDVYPHLAKHVVRGHITLHESDRVGRELRGEIPRRTDVVISGMIQHIEAQGDDAAKIVSDDADVPPEIRWTTQQFTERLMDEARSEGDQDAIDGLQKVLDMLTKRGVIR